MARILVVDDEPDLLAMLRLNLEVEGYDVVDAGDGATALERLDADAGLDLVLLDMMMPVLDGWGVLERLRERPSAPPVVVVSAKSQPRDALRALELGAVDYVVKPFDLEALLDLVAATLERSPAEHDEHRAAVAHRLGGS